MKKDVKIWKKTPLLGGIEPTSLVTAFTARRSGEYRFPGEMHDFWELVLVRQGSLWVAEEQKIQNLKKNMFILHKPMSFHRLWCTADSDATIKIITFEATGKMLSRLEGLSGSCPWQLADRLAQTIDLAETFLRGKGGDPEELSAQIKTRLASILCELIDFEHSEDDVAEVSDVSRILTTIDEHYLEGLTLEKLAHYCRMSESKIKKEFHSVYDGGVMKYICRLKMRDAAAMIERGMSADQICEALSLCDKNYFSFVFKREIGMTPSEYRRTRFFED